MSLLNVSVEKIFASALHDVHNVLRVFVKVANEAEKSAPAIETLTSFFPNYGPTAVAIDQAAFSLLGKAAALAGAVNGDIPLAAPVQITLDPTEIAQIRKLLIDAAPVFKSLGISVPA